MSIVGNTYLEYGVPVTIVAQWRTQDRIKVESHYLTLGGQVAYLVFEVRQWGEVGNAKARTGPRNVLIRRSNGDLIVRPFRGLRKP